MSYFEEQEEAWLENDCKGSIEDYDPYDADSWPSAHKQSTGRNRSRNLLALEKLEAFAAWAVTQGYKREATKGTYEILRLKMKGQTPILFFKRDRGEHATSYGEGTALVQQWINTRKEKKEAVK